uniref:Predicted protein n=1 Tax=Hordeum vulgare subsp. vulgare TaxID=112509 RepID=F2EJP1_HORVV|nr:predicted protein [Hordeum vulgare subsp. vulgare]
MDVVWSPRPPCLIAMLPRIVQERGCAPWVFMYALVCWVEGPSMEDDTTQVSTMPQAGDRPLLILSRTNDTESMAKLGLRSPKYRLI